MIKQAVVTDKSPTTDTGDRKPGVFHDGEKLTKESTEKLPFMSKIFNKTTNELEYTESVHGKEIIGR